MPEHETTGVVLPFSSLAELLPQFSFRNLHFIFRVGRHPWVYTPMSLTTTAQSTLAQVPEPARDGNFAEYPLLQTMLRSMGLAIKAFYTCGDVAELFDVSTRTIQSRVKDGTLPSRKLIGGGRFLPADLEAYLSNASAQHTTASGTSPSFAL